VLRKAATSW